MGVHLKHISITFDTRVERSLFITSADYAYFDNGALRTLGGSFDVMTPALRLQGSNDSAEILLLQERRAISMFLNIRTVEVDITNSYCATGCCRLLSLEHEEYVLANDIQQLRIVGLRHEPEVVVWQERWDLASGAGSRLSETLMRRKVDLNSQTSFV